MSITILKDRRIDHDPHLTLKRDDSTGIAWIEDTHCGLGHSCHANISVTGSVRGMKDRGYWGQKDRTVSSHGWIYNIDIFIATDDLDKIAADHCQCAACQENREKMEKSSSHLAARR